MTLTQTPFAVPADTLRLMREFVRGVIAGAECAGDISEMFEDEWVAYSSEYDLNIIRDENDEFLIAVHPIVPHPTNPNLRTTDGGRFVNFTL